MTYDNDVNNWADDEDSDYNDVNNDGGQEDYGFNDETIGILKQLLFILAFSGLSLPLMLVIIK